MTSKSGKVFTAYPDTYDKLKEFSRYNRKYSTFSEDILWERLRRNALGVKFRRQHCIGDYIADFVCLDKKLIIEVDGRYHNNKLQKSDDDNRTDFLNHYGYYVLRFTNDMVETDINYVIDRIQELLNKL